MSKHDAFLRWWIGCFAPRVFTGKRGAETLVKTLAVEKLNAEELNSSEREELVSFRHLSHRARIQTAQKVLDTLRSERQEFRKQQKAAFKAHQARLKAEADSTLSDSSLPKCLVCREQYGKDVNAEFYAYIAIQNGSFIYQDWNPVCVKHRHAYPAFRLEQAFTTEREEVYSLVRRFFEGDDVKTREWMRTPNTLLGGIAPKDLIAMRPGKVIRFVRQQLADNMPFPVSELA